LPQPNGCKVADKIAIQFIEADVEIGFALVDEAKAYHVSGEPEFSERALHDAEDVVAGVERRLQGLSDSESWPFHPLVTELRKQIAALEREPPDLARG
jgi:hypothetical protein